VPETTLAFRTRRLDEALPDALRRARASILEFANDKRPGVASLASILEVELQRADLAMIQRDDAHMLFAFNRLQRLEGMMDSLRRLDAPPYLVIDGAEALDRAMADGDLPP
jgi:hypothetical protein